MNRGKNKNNIHFTPTVLRRTTMRLNNNYDGIRIQGGTGARVLVPHNVRTTFACRGRWFFRCLRSFVADYVAKETKHPLLLDEGPGQPARVLEGRPREATVAVGPQRGRFVGVRQLGQVIHYLVPRTRVVVVLVKTLSRERMIKYRRNGAPHYIYIPIYIYI